MFSIKDREDLEKLNEIVSLKNQVKVERLQDKPGEQNFYEDRKKSLKQLLIHLKTCLKIKRKL